MRANHCTTRKNHDHTFLNNWSWLAATSGRVLTTTKPRPFFTQIAGRYIKTTTTTTKRQFFYKRNKNKKDVVAYTRASRGFCKGVISL